MEYFFKTKMPFAQEQSSLRSPFMLKTLNSVHGSSICRSFDLECLALPKQNNLESHTRKPLYLKTDMSDWLPSHNGAEE